MMDVEQPLTARERIDLMLPYPRDLLVPSDADLILAAIRALHEEVA